MLKVPFADSMSQVSRRDADGTLSVDVSLASVSDVKPPQYSPPPSYDQAVRAAALHCVTNRRSLRRSLNEPPPD